MALDCELARGQLHIALGPDCVTSWDHAYAREDMSQLAALGHVLLSLKLHL